MASDPTSPLPDTLKPEDPWLLLDLTTVAQTSTLLNRLAAWLHSEGDNPQLAGCAYVLSRGETEDPLEIACWIDTLTSRLERLIDLETHQP